MVELSIDDRRTTCVQIYRRRVTPWMRQAASLTQRCLMTYAAAEARTAGTAVLGQPE
jgi:hypothetical protein